MRQQKTHFLNAHSSFNPLDKTWKLGETIRLQIPPLLEAHSSLNPTDKTHLQSHTPDHTGERTHNLGLPLCAPLEHQLPHGAVAHEAHNPAQSGRAGTAERAVDGGGAAVEEHALEHRDVREAGGVE